MPDPRPLTGLFGKVPAHGDFVRRGLPSSFVTPWDAWLQVGVAAAREQLGAHWAAAWDSAPAWRFALPAGACGPDAVAGVMLPSQDQVGRRFPITLAALLPPGAPPPEADWFDAVEAAALAGLAGHADADALSAALPVPGEPIRAQAFALPPVAPAAAPHHDDAPAASWAASAAAAPLPEPVDPPEDVLALLAAPPDPMAAGADDDALAFLIGASAAPPAATAPEDSRGMLDVLVGSAGAPPLPPLDPAPHPGPPPDAQDGTLAGLIGAAAAAPAWPAFDPPAMLPAAGGDGTLADLIGAGNAGDAPPESVAERPAPVPAEDDDVLAGLIGAAFDPAAPGGEDAAPAPALPGGEAGATSAEGLDLLPESVPAAWPDFAEATDAAPAIAATAEAPPAPQGGGWWTRGGAYVPPLVWPLPGLPAPADFAYLLEAAA